MCYSAQIWQDYRKYTRLYGASLAIEDFVSLYWHRQQGGKAATARAMDAAFASPGPGTDGRIATALAQANRVQANGLEQELFALRRRLADAERSLQVRTTVKASESRRIATAKITRALERLDELRGGTLVDSDSRIYPGHFAPVMVWQQGRRVLRPMRYQCRPAGKPAAWDRKYPGTYNARRDNLQGYWKDLFGFSHGVVAMQAFYENVSVHRSEGRELAAGESERNTVLEFRPRDAGVMLVACLWSHWRGADGEELLSFAAITDDPPPEVAAAGHDRCVIPIKPANLDAWLDPDPRDLAAQQGILDDRERPYYEHRKAA